MTYILCHYLIIIHVFHTKYTSNQLTYLLKYHLRLTDENYNSTLFGVFLYCTMHISLLIRIV